jgi:hypothetical protein
MLDMQYKLLNAETTDDLNKQVNDLLKDGWQLHGNPVESSFRIASVCMTRHSFTQAMIKKIKRGTHGRGPR